MTDTSHKKPADYITPLEINGLNGRMLYMPSSTDKKREILFVYGHHSTLERWWGVVQDLNQYGNVTMPDMPGFGGMDSLYKIGKVPDIDTLADYLATFIKLRYKRKKVTIFGLSFGFVVLTRMFQKYPEMVSKVNLLVSVVGFAHKSDFSFSPTRYKLYLASSSLFTYKWSAIFFRNVFLHPTVLRLAYAKTHNAKIKFEGMSKKEHKKTMKFEIHLWHANDVRTHWKTTHEFLLVDNCQVKVNLPLWHISVKADKYFDNHTVEQHLRVIYTDFHEVKSSADKHAPSVVAEVEVAAHMIPDKIRQILSKSV